MPEERITGTLHLTKGRLEGLSDGIFAFSMTLLVIGINIPEKTALVQTNAYVMQVLLSLHSDLFHYVLAFLILGAFWLGHHSVLHGVREIDPFFVWLNLMTLMFVALLPFTTSFSGDFPDVPLAAIVFEANLLAIGIGMFCQGLYAAHGHRLVDPGLDPAYIRKARLRSLMVPCISVLCIAAALAGVTWSTAIYLVLPIIGFLIERSSRR
jgi:uncharacterized membrane protein